MITSNTTDRAIDLYFSYVWSIDPPASKTDVTILILTNLVLLISPTIIAALLLTSRAGVVYQISKLSAISTIRLSWS
ncbi:hypothetical protein BTN49_2889 [Candidatus Enterovibrio escicola]|uniref:Uncharacterized protein n=1 Tax=Candidatus Enterovibrio escicola TaxID=1927127 RepID=A0A2A5SZP0_9GAMM|nr:hypothetical protein BTN49_2889 [Candidatus Enterovibrio escacola]